MLDRDTAHKILRFCLTGGFVFGVDMAMLWLWSKFTPVRVAVTAAYIIAVTVHFCLNKWWVFRNRSETNDAQIFKYVLTVGASYLCMISSFSMALRFLTANIFVAKLIALPPTTALGFLMMKLFVFSERPQR
jgi:putative flippase GtrA